MTIKFIRFINGTFTSVTEIDTKQSLFENLFFYTFYYLLLFPRLFYIIFFCAIRNDIV